MWRSLPQMPQRPTCTTTSPASGTGSGTVSNVSGWCRAWKATAFMSVVQRLHRPELHPAVDHDMGAGHVTARVAGQQQSERLDLVWFGHPAHRHQLVPRLFRLRVLLDPAIADIGHERSRSDRVHADAIGGEFISGMAHEMLHPGLGRHIGYADDCLVDFGGVRTGDDNA